MPAFVAERRELPRRNAAATHRARPVRGIQDYMVAQGQEFLENAVVQQPGHLLLFLGKEIRPAHIADKQRVARENADGLVAERRVRDRDGDAFVGVSGGLEDAQDQAAKVKAISFRHRIPVGKRQGLSVVDGGAGAPGQFLRADDVVFVAVGFKDARNAGAVSVRDVDIDAAVAARIDNGGLASVANDVGEVRQAFRTDGFQEHAASPWACARFVRAQATRPRCPCIFAPRKTRVCCASPARRP